MLAETEPWFKTLGTRGIRNEDEMSHVEGKVFLKLVHHENPEWVWASKHAHVESEAKHA